MYRESILDFYRLTEVKNEDIKEKEKNILYNRRWERVFL